MKGDLSALDTRGKRRRPSKYTEQELHKLRDWMLDCIYTRDSPLMVDQIRKRNLYGEYQFDPITNEHIKIQKKLICVFPWELHKLMQKPVSEGGFAGACGENGKVRFSMSALIIY